MIKARGSSTMTVHSDTKDKSTGHLVSWSVAVAQQAQLGQDREGTTHQWEEFSENLLIDVEAGETSWTDARSGGSVPAGHIILVKSPQMAAPQYHLQWKILAGANIYGLLLRSYGSSCDACGSQVFEVDFKFL